jgi:hypothetical protein
VSAELQAFIGRSKSQIEIPDGRIVDNVAEEDVSTALQKCWCSLITSLLITAGNSAFHGSPLKAHFKSVCVVKIALRNMPCRSNVLQTLCCCSEALAYDSLVQFSEQECEKDGAKGPHLSCYVCVDL